MDFSLINKTPFAIAMALLGVIVFTHIVGALVRGRLAAVLGYLDVALHLGLFAALMFSHVTLQFLVLVFMFSVFVFSLARFIPYLVNRSRRADEDGKDATFVQHDEILTGAPEVTTESEEEAAI